MSPTSPASTARRLPSCRPDRRGPRPRRGVPRGHRQTGIIRAVLDATPDAIHLVDNDGGRPQQRALPPAARARPGALRRRRRTLPRGRPERGRPRRVPPGHRPAPEADPQEAIHQFTVDDSGRSFVRFAAPVLDREATPGSPVRPPRRDRRARGRPREGRVPRVGEPRTPDSADVGDRLPGAGPRR